MRNPHLGCWGDRSRNFCDSFRIWKCWILMRIKISTICGGSLPPREENSAIWSKIENLKFWSNRRNFCRDRPIRPNGGCAYKIMRIQKKLKISIPRNNPCPLPRTNSDQTAEISALIAPSAQMGVAHTKSWEFQKKWKSRFSEIICPLPRKKIALKGTSLP